MTLSDTYPSFLELARRTREGRDFRRVVRRRRSPIAVVAPHGGGIEPGTSEVARALAGCDFSLYCFEGLRPSGNDELHVTSHRFDDPLCVQLARRARTVVAVHGCAGLQRAVYVGGLDASLKARLVAALRAAGFSAAPGTGPLAGCYIDNVCNQGASGRGVQLEITEGLRRAMFADLTWRGRQIKTRTFGRFVVVVREEICEA